MRPIRFLAVVGCVPILVACAGKSQHVDGSEPEAGAGGRSAPGGTGGRSVGGSAGSGGDVTAGTSGGSSAPSENECLRMRDALDRSCATDDDCYLGTWTRCGIHQVSDMLGLSAAGLTDLESAAALCKNPRSGAKPSSTRAPISMPATPTSSPHSTPRFGSFCRSSSSTAAAAAPTFATSAPSRSVRCRPRPLSWHGRITA